MGLMARLRNTQNRRALFFRLIAIGLVSLGVLSAGLTSLPGGDRGLRTVDKLWDALAHNSLSISDLDPARQRQIDAAVTTIRDHPFTGAGWLETVSSDGYVIHNVYLQLWSDLGIIGLSIYLAIFFPALWFSARWLRDNEKDSLALLPISIVLSHLFSSLFHPVSTELTEWVLIAFSLGIMIRLLCINEPRNQ